VQVEASFVKRYFWSSHLLMRLSRSERIFLDFITEEMDENNYITNCKLTRNRFNNLLKKIGQKPYSDSTINKCFLGLVDSNLIVKQKNRGLYQVSPLFFFKGTEEKRAKVIRNGLEELNKVPINKYRRELLIDKVFSSSRERPTD
jgi:hypothetical protein